MAAKEVKKRTKPKLIRFSDPAYAAIRQSQKLFLEQGMDLSENAVVNTLVVKGANQLSACSGIPGASTCTRSTQRS